MNPSSFDSLQPAATTTATIIHDPRTTITRRRTGGKGAPTPPAAAPQHTTIRNMWKQSAQDRIMTSKISMTKNTNSMNNNETMPFFATPPLVHSPSTTTSSSFSCICRNPEVCREISRRWEQDLGETQYSKFIKLPRRTLMDVINDNSQVGKHVSAYRKAALHCLGHTTEDGDNDCTDYHRRGRMEAFIIERISIVHFHPSVIPIILMQEEEEEKQQSDDDGRKSSCGMSSSSRKCKLDKGRIPYALGQSLGMPDNSLSPTLDSSGMITYFALPNYHLNHAAIDVADAIMTKELKNQQVNSNYSMMTTINPTLVTGQYNEPSANIVFNANATHAEPSIDQLKHDNIQLLKMYIQLAERYEKEVQARTACEQLSLVLTSELEKMSSLLNNITNGSNEYQLINNETVGGYSVAAAAAAINTDTTSNLASNDINADDQVCVVAKLLELLQREKGQYAGSGGLGFKAPASLFSSASAVRNGGGRVEGARVAGSEQFCDPRIEKNVAEAMLLWSNGASATARDHDVAAWTKAPAGSSSVQSDDNMLCRFVSSETEKRKRGA